MEFKGISLSESPARMALWQEDSYRYLEEELDSDYYDLRESLLEEFNKIQTGHKYTVDYKFGIVLYVVLSRFGFTIRDAANDDKWRYLSLNVIPDIVAKRWGKTAEIRYYKQGSRIWIKTIWWYIHLSRQNNINETVEIIKDNSTDQILQLVDRIGKHGYYVAAYRRIMYFYWKARKINPNVGEEEFRKIMTLHTALCKTIEPGLCEGGEEGYAKMLFDRLGVKVC